MNQEELGEIENKNTDSTIEINSYRFKSHLEVVDLIRSTPPLKRRVGSEISLDEESHGIENTDPAQHFRNQCRSNEDLEAVEQDSARETPIVNIVVPDVKEDMKLSG